jgi:hypothetical protein
MTLYLTHTHEHYEQDFVIREATQDKTHCVSAESTSFHAEGSRKAWDVS